MHVAGGCPDRIPYLQGFDFQGLRFNLQREGTNLQTFLAITGEVPVIEGLTANGRGLPAHRVERSRLSEELRQAVGRWDATRRN
jgi:hypothetical protein